MKRLLLACLVLCSMLWQEALAQGRTVSGKVTAAEDGSPLPGVNVVLKGTSIGTATNADGTYSLTVNSNESVLIFSFIGLKTQEIIVGDRSVVDISLEQDARQLGEVVVTGVGERDKASYSGSISSLSSDVIENKPVASVDQILQGNVAGLQLSASSGTPGSVQNIRIRGVSSISADNEPLYVIDGVPVVSGRNDNSAAYGNLSVLSSLSPNDIANISVLKDATASAIYGARGSNGVIIITTKSGKVSAPVISFSAQTGFVSNAVDGPKMLNAAQLEELYYESIINAGLATTVEEAEAYAPSGWDGVTDTDWSDVVSNDDAMTQSYDISLRGGNEKTNYYSSLGYFTQDGTSVGSDFQRVNGKFNVTNNLSRKFTLQNSTTASHTVQNGQLEGSAYYGNPNASVMFLSPWDKAYNDDGSINIDLAYGSNYNPLYIAEHDISKRKQARVMNNTVLRFDVTERLSITSTIGLDYLQTEELYYQNRIHGDGVDLDDVGSDGYSQMYSNRNFNWVIKNMLDYRFEFGSHHKLDVKAIHEAQKNNYYTVGAGGLGFAADGLYYPSSAANPDYVSGYEEDWAINAVTASANYIFLDKIAVDATLRGEGSSRFASGNRWGAFWSVGSSWVLTKEAFLSEIKWLNMAKVRASYGKTGNAGIGINEYQSFLSYTGTYDGSAGVNPAQLGNKELSWENSKLWNMALDFELLHRISFTVEYFQRKSYDLLLDVPLTRTSGFTSQVQNVGEMLNKGIEGSVSADVIVKDAFKWSIGANFTSLKNEVTELPMSPDGTEIGVTTSTRIVTEGESVYSWYLKKWAGVDPETGNPLWYLNGRGGETTSVYNEAARAIQGNSMPTFYGSLNSRVDFKGIYLMGSLYYSTGNKVYDTWAGYTKADGRRFAQSNVISNSYASQYDHWQEPGDISDNPRNVFGNTSGSASASTRHLYDGEFMRLKDVTLGYNFPKELISNLRLSNATVYVRGTNIWTHTKDKNLEFDPEVKPDGALSLNAPPLKSVVFGIKLDF